MGDVVGMAGLWAAAAAEDDGATRADLRAIRTLLTTIFRKYKTEMQVGRTVAVIHPVVLCIVAKFGSNFRNEGSAYAHVELGASLR